MRIQVLNEMPNLTRKQTGLPYAIWLDSAGDDRDVGHNVPRLKVNVDGNRVPISITDNPKILINRKINIKNFKKISDWIILNKELILGYYSGLTTWDELEKEIIKSK